jgi:hypothetical protein
MGSGADRNGTTAPPGVNSTPGAGRKSPTEHHRVAIARSLQWADEAAQDGNHADAMAWLRVIEAIGEELPHAYRIKQHAWRLALQAAD